MSATVESSGPTGHRLAGLHTVDLVSGGRIVATGSLAGIFVALDERPPGVYEIERLDGTVVAVATVRVDGTWRLEGGKRHGR